MRTGRRVGVDVGKARVGVAVCDPAGVLATPLETVPRRGRQGTAGGPRRVAALASQAEAMEIIVGLPRSLNGTEGPAAQDARAFARVLAPLVAPAQVRLVDERFTTTSAHADLRAAGMDTRRHRGVVDQQAAVRILQAALDLERSSGSPPGIGLDSDRLPVPLVREGDPAAGTE